MGPTSWPRERSKALIQYLDQNKSQFQDFSTKNKIGFPSAAQHISQKFELDPPYDSKKIERHLRKLYDENKKENTTFTGFLRDGSSCLNLSFLAEEPSPDSKNSEDQVSNAFQALDLEDSSVGSELFVRQGKEDSDDDRAVSTCHECLSKEMKLKIKDDLIHHLRGRLQSEAETEPYTRYGSRKPRQAGPDDKQIRLRMEDIFKYVGLIVSSYQSGGFGSNPVPIVTTIEKEYPELCSLFKRVFCVEPADSLFEALGQSSIGLPKKEELLQALFGAAIWESALDSDFPGFFNDTNIVFKRYQLLIRKRGEQR